MFFVNVPIVIIAVAAVIAFVPESRDGTCRPRHRRAAALDLGDRPLVFTIIEAPEWGWAARRPSLASLLQRCCARFVGGSCGAEPDAAVSVFANRRFSAASVAITAAFFALFGFIFLITQYFQLIAATAASRPVCGRCRSPLDRVAASFSHHVGERLGTTPVVAPGWRVLGRGFGMGLPTVERRTPYLEIVGQMILLGSVSVSPPHRLPSRSWGH